MRRKISTTVYLTQDQVDRLKSLSDRTCVTQAEFVRRGLDMMLDKYEAKTTEEIYAERGLGIASRMADAVIEVATKGNES